jgi:hypothetical protein
MKFQVLTAASMKTVFWDVALCSLVKYFRRFRGACCLHHQGNKSLMEAASTCETSVNFYQTTPRNNPEDSHLKVIVTEQSESQREDENPTLPQGQCVSGERKDLRCSMCLLYPVASPLTVPTSPWHRVPRLSTDETLIILSIYVHTTIQPFHPGCRKFHY